jgi:hypothetical protein
MLFDQPDPAPSNCTRVLRGTAAAGLLLNYFAIVVLISASTAAMMLCPCDSVGLRDHYAIFLAGLAALFGLAAALLIYRRMRHDSGITPFLKAVIAIAIAGFAIYAELYAAMRVVAWLARPG